MGKKNIYSGLTEAEIEEVHELEKSIRSKWNKVEPDLGELIDLQYDEDAQKWGLFFENSGYWYYE